ncbi:MAG: T9SS type A sorting domain-containing protein, partial [Candidatus Delongbacteria bacterium]|nr:T9SS type A sorting domain-containing protein [Candidatus Delongbacteria bacterium]
IRAYNEWGISANSNTISVMTSVLPISAPSDLTARRMPDNRILLQWIDQADNETGFVIERKLDNESEFGMIRSAGANSSETILDPIGTGQNAQFRIKAINDQTESDYSNIADLQEMNAPILSQIENDTIEYREGSSPIPITASLMIQDSDSPELLNATIAITDHYDPEHDQLQYTGTSVITGQWDPSSGILSLTGTASIADYQTALRQVHFYNPAINTMRSVKSISFCVNDGYLLSNITHRTIRIISPIHSPSNIQASIHPGGIQLHWQDNSNNEQGFIITRYGPSGGQIPYTPTIGNPVYSPIDSVKSGTSSYLDSGIMEGESYLYQILAYDSQGSLSDRTDQSRLSDPIVYPPYRPGGLTAICADNVIHLNWTDNSSIEQGFILERSETDNLHYSERIRLPSDITMFDDSSLVNGITYYYRLSAYHDTLVSPACDEISVTGIITAIAEPERGIPKDYMLSQNFPNPFNPSTTICYALPKAGNVRLSICNLLGQEIMVLIDRSVTEGYHHLVFNAEGLKSGIYFYRLETQEKALIKKMILMK